MRKTDYRLRSAGTGRVYDDGDDGWRLDAPGEARPALLQTVYPARRLTVGPADRGLFRFADWLPVRRELTGSSAPVTYRSEGLAGRLGLRDLWITFSGYWPERGATMRSCTFKEAEAYAVCARRRPDETRTLVVASAGNTARAFARVCGDNRIPLLLCVPQHAVGEVWTDVPPAACVRLVCTRPGSDYLDAIQLANTICRLDGYVPEGGARNVARRDGMGTTVLSAVTTIGRIPDVYVQAVGSGTGAIAAWEARERLVADGRYGDAPMRLLLSQNAEVAPLADAWAAGSRDLLPIDEARARVAIAGAYAPVLANRRPPYGLAGGLFDALTDTGGDVLRITAAEAAAADRLFREAEGIDPDPAAAVAVGSLVQAVERGAVERDAVVLLNVTGGGRERLRAETTCTPLSPSAAFDIDPPVATVRDVLDQDSARR